MPEKPPKKKVHFALDHKGIALFVLGACLVGVLVFADGLLVGMGLYRQSVWPILVAGRQAQAVHNQELAADSAAAAQRQNHPAKRAARSRVPEVPTAPPPQPAPTPTAIATAAAAAPANACGLALTASAQTGQPEYDLQLGSFQDAGNAASLVASLKTHGCTAQVMQLTDAQHRVWNVVRIGPFATLEQAAAAAAQLRRSDGLLALVRPVAAI